MKTREIKTTALLLDTGEIGGTNNLGVFVVVSQRAARWHGEDVDVYGHINTWYTVREANETEVGLWDQAVAAATARKSLRRALNAPTSFVFSEASAALCPTAAATRALDSYDDTWTPPVCISLTPEQVAVERNYVTARANLKTAQAAKQTNS